MERSIEFNDTFTVSQITELLKDVLEATFASVSVKGEISGLKTSAQGHIYFTLKDKGACISCVIWRSKAMYLPFRPKDGDQVTVKGQLTVYEPRGQYQIVCNSIDTIGTGEILVELERRKKQYEAAGLFDEARKKPIPRQPSRIGVVTSPTGAALRDILNVLERRSSGIDVIVFPAVVQGPEAAEQIARRIRQANEYLAADVLIVGRGGGSIEDLLPFSDDKVVMAVAQSTIPVISAVGHEIDWALCDYAADLRAPTPSAAAELVSQNRQEQLDRIIRLEQSMKLLASSRIRDTRLIVSGFSLDRVRHVLSSRLSNLRMKSDELLSLLNRMMSESMRNAKDRIRYGRETAMNQMQFRLQRERSRMEKDIESMKSLSPLSILGRGYSIALDSNGNTIKSTKALPEGKPFTLRLSDGLVDAVSKGDKNAE